MVVRLIFGIQFVAFLLASVCHAAVIDAVKLEVDGSSPPDPPGDVIVVVLLLDKSDEQVAVLVHGFLVDADGTKRPMVAPDSAGDEKPPLVRRDLLREPAECALPIDRRRFHSLRVVIPYSTIHLPKGTYSLGYTVSVVTNQEVTSTRDTNPSPLIVKEDPRIQTREEAYTVMVQETSTRSVPYTVDVPLTRTRSVSRNIAEVERGPVEESAGDAKQELDSIWVYYGTDRALLKPDWIWYARWFLWVLLAVLALPFFCGLGRGTLRREIREYIPTGKTLIRLTAVVAICGVVYASYKCISRMIKMQRVGFSYGNERGEFDVIDEEKYCHFGKCLVNVPDPEERIPGVLSRPNPLRGEFWEDESRDYMVMKIEPLSTCKAFFDDVANAATTHHGRRQAFVFIHGFNVSFDEAALRTAQMAIDLDFDGAPMFYSWPSKDAFWKYTHDESSVAWATGHLKFFLSDLRELLPKARIHLCAHSMGNRALTEALRRLSVELAESGACFQEVVLAAPDIDAETFRNDIAPAMRQTAENITLYACSNDKALEVSKRVHGYPRAGDSGKRIVISKCLESIDVVLSESQDILDHSYYGGEAVLKDMKSMLDWSLRPKHRGLLPEGEAWQLTAWPNGRDEN